MPPAELQVFALVMGLFGGLALFLFGMEHMTSALKAVAGERMRAVLATLTTSRLMGVLTGAFVTAVIQSSSVTTVLVVGFITSGLLSLSQSIGVIMGANVGTTITAQIIAFKVTRFALLLVAVGFGFMFLSKRHVLKHYGGLIMGLGLIFLGMGVMGDAMAPLRAHQPFLDWMTRLANPAVGILAGALFTALVQSSSATTGIVIVLASQGLISLAAGIALMLGANIGTCVTALLAGLGKPREAMRAAAVHVLFNVVGVLIWLPFLDQLATLVTWFSPSAEALTGMDRLAADTPRQVANAHTVFNIVNTIVLFPAATVFARVVEWLVPDRPIGAEDEIRAKYLDLELISTPSLALDRARLEILHMGDLVKQMLVEITPAVAQGSGEQLQRIAERDNAVDTLHGRILTYLGKISQLELTERQTDELIKLLGASNDLESIGDIIETNLVALGRRRIEQGVRISDATRDVIDEFHRSVVAAFDAALLAVTQKNPEAARHVIGMKRDMKRLSVTAAVHGAQRLVAEEPNRLPAYTVESDVLDQLKRIYYFCKRMARSVVPESESEGDLGE